MDLKWIAWQALVPLTAPLLVWLAVCLARSQLQASSGFTSHVKTLGDVVEEYGWLMYAVFLSIQCIVAISDANEPPRWIFWLNIGVFLASLLLLAVAFFARFEDNGSGTVTMKSSSEVQVGRFAAGAVAVAAAIVGYFAFSEGAVL